jgi:UDP-GlcNAc:undecaprenyl-phosphate GlcNAc-1-phosphate transferase
MVQISALLISLFATFVAFNIMRLTEIPERIKTANYRDVEVSITGGIILFFASGIFLILFYGLNVLDNVKFSADNLTYVLLAFPFLMTGLLDDFFGGKGSQGFLGHFRAVKNGRITTGFIKFFFGVVFSIVISFFINPSDASLLNVFFGALLIAGSSNIANLLDLSPGRCLKVYLLFALPLIAIGTIPAFIFFGLIAFLIIPDLSEQLMIGDSGANFVGAFFGIVILSRHSTILTIIAAVFFLVLNVLSERVSFTKMFAGNPVLNAFDKFGRKYK